MDNSKDQAMAIRVNYLNDFKCIGGICTDNCCIGWSVEIDKDTYGKYVNIKDKKLKEIINKYIYKNEDYYDKHVDYALVELHNNKRCPFLDKENYCLIQKEKGEDYLSNVCGSYPRIVNRINGVYEISATISCPEAARKALSLKKGIEFIEEKLIDNKINIINISVNTKDIEANYLTDNFDMLRKITIEILKDRNFKLNERVYILAHLFNELEEALTKGNWPEMLDLHEKYKVGNNRKKFIPKINKKRNSGESILIDIAKKFNNIENIDNKKYFSYMFEFQKGIGTPYDIESDLEYIIENYLVNYVFQSLFPANEGVMPLEAFQKLTMRYSLIRCYLKGILDSKKTDKERIIIDFIQVFSKALEHNYTYFDDINKYLNKNYKNKYDTLLEIIMI